VSIKQLKATYLISLTIFISQTVIGQSTYEIKNLGANVNSTYADINPIVSDDGKTLYFVRSNAPENYNTLNGESQDIWMSEQDENGQWKPAVHLGKELNRQQFNTLFNVTAGGNRLLIGGSYVNQVYWGLGFSFIDRKDGKWGEPYELNIKGFEKMCRGFSASVDMPSDNKTLILSFSEEEDSKTNDLYLSRLLDNGKWTEPKPLGNAINTAYDESTPFMAADGVTLYFSSNRPGGYGQNDIYLTRRLDDSWTKWSEPVNLGPQINTEQWDGYYTIPASGDIAYMVSYKNTLGKADIVQIRLNKNVKPEPVAMLTGKVLDSKTQQPVEAQIIYEELPSGAEAGKISFWSMSGEYKIVLPYGKHYGISARAAGYIPVAVNVDLSKTGDYKEIVQNLMLVPIEAGQVIRLNNIFFDEYSDTLKDESLPELNRLVRLLKDNNNLTIEIAGHTDAVGSDAENQILSEKRATSVKNYLVKRGIKANRLFSIGYGESQPVADNNNDYDRQLNRRVEFKILKK
jgi:OmpA-OmpF porin, OOP family